MEEYEFEKPEGSYILRKEPIGVVGMITPWNWPINQVNLKVIPALASGCTVVLKPSEVAPLSSMLLAEMIDEVGFPKGVFNLVNYAILKEWKLNIVLNTNIAAFIMRSPWLTIFFGQITIFKQFNYNTITEGRRIRI